MQLRRGLFARLFQVLCLWLALSTVRETRRAWQNVFVVRDERGFVDLLATLARVNFDTRERCTIEAEFSTFAKQRLLYQADPQVPPLRDFCLPQVARDRAAYQTRLEQLRLHMLGEKARHRLLGIAAWQVGVPLRAVLLQHELLLNARIVAQKEMDACDIMLDGQVIKRIPFAKQLTVAYETAAGAAVEKAFANNQACALTYLMT